MRSATLRPSIERGARQPEQELLAPHPRHRVHAAHLLVEDPREVNQRGVSRWVSQRIVERLELVEVERDQGSPLDADQPEPFVQPPPVEQSGQRVLASPPSCPSASLMRHLQPRARRADRLAHLPDGRLTPSGLPSGTRHATAADRLIEPDDRRHARGGWRRRSATAPAERDPGSSSPRSTPEATRASGAVRREHLVQGAPVAEPRDAYDADARGLRAPPTYTSPPAIRSIWNASRMPTLPTDLDAHPLLHLRQVVQHRPAADPVEQCRQVVPRRLLQPGRRCRPSAAPPPPLRRQTPPAGVRHRAVPPSCRRAGRMPRGAAR